MARQNSFMKRAACIVGSRQFFWCLAALFIIQAVWIALSGHYPMSFDENFHLGIIRLYAHHISPFWNGPPAGSDPLGPVARDPSYLYQYLMSFPYRLVSAFTSDQTIQVLTMRFINIGLFAAALPLYRRLLLKTGASRALVHFCLAVFILIPVAPLLAAQINYDNLFLPLTALSLLMAVNLTRELERHRRINGQLLMGLVVVGLLTSLVKYAFLPILVIIAVYTAFSLRRTYPGPRLWSELKLSLAAIPRLSRWFMVAAIVLSLGLFTERYGINFVRYHNPVPSCSDVLSINRCQAYGPWHRDYNYALQKSADATGSPMVFAADWFYAMWFRLFFAVDGPASTFQTRGPLIMPGIGSLVFLALGLVAVVAKGRRLLRRYDRSVLLFLLAVAGFYSAVLFLDEYGSFLKTGRPVAINGRYLLPILPLLLVWLALGTNELFRRRSSLKLAVASASLICMLWGGGALTYILRSNDAWYWPDASLMHGLNHDIRHAIGPWTPGYRHPFEFMGSHGT